MVLRLALVCHAPTAATRTASFPADEPSDGPGLDRARAVSHRAAAPSACVRSPALAAQQTAEALKLSAWIDPDLRECDYGPGPAALSTPSARRIRAGAAQWLTDPALCPHGGESVLAVLSRVSAWLAGLDDRSAPVIAVTHSAVVRAAVVSALGAPPSAFWRIDFAPLSTTLLQGRGRTWTLSSINQRRGAMRN